MPTSLGHAESGEPDEQDDNEQRKDSTLPEVDEDLVREVHTARILEYLSSPSTQTYSMQERRAYLQSLDVPKEIIDEYLEEDEDTGELDIATCIQHAKELLSGLELRAYSRVEKRDMLRVTGISDYRIAIILDTVWREIHIEQVRNYLNAPSTQDMPNSEVRAFLMSLHVPNDVINEFLPDEDMSDIEHHSSVDSDVDAVYDDDTEEQSYHAEFQIMVDQIREILDGPNFRNRAVEEKKDFLRSRGVLEDVIEEVFEENADTAETFAIFGEQHAGQATRERGDREQERPPEDSLQTNISDPAAQQDTRAEKQRFIKFVRNMLNQPEYQDWSTRKKRVLLKLWTIPPPIIVKALGVEYESEKQYFEAAMTAEIKKVRQILDSREFKGRTAMDMRHILKSAGIPRGVVRAVLGPEREAESSDVSLQEYRVSGGDSPPSTSYEDANEVAEGSKSSSLQQIRDRLNSEYISRHYGTIQAKQTLSQQQRFTQDVIQKIPENESQPKGTPPQPGVALKIQFSYVAGASNMIMDDMTLDEPESLPEKKGLFGRHKLHGRSTYVPVTSARRAQIQRKRERVDGEMKAFKLARDIRHNVRGKSKGALRRENSYLRASKSSLTRRFAIVGTGANPVKMPPWISRNAREVTPAIGSAEDKRMRMEARDSAQHQTPTLTLNTHLPPPVRRKSGEEPSSKRERVSSLDDMSPRSPTKKAKNNNDRPPVKIKLRKVAKKVTAEDVEREGSYMQDETEAEKYARLVGSSLEGRIMSEKTALDALMMMGAGGDEGAASSSSPTNNSPIVSVESPRSPSPGRGASDDDFDSDLDLDSYEDDSSDTSSEPGSMGAPLVRFTKSPSPEYGQPGPATVRTKQVTIRGMPAVEDPEPIVNFKIERNRFLHYLPGSKQCEDEEKGWIDA